jgi:pantoate kinase
MATTNDITNDSLITKASTDNYRSNYDAIFTKKPKQEAAMQELTALSEELGMYEDKSKDVCFECHKQSHSMGCGSKSVYDAYITLRDSDKWKYFTDVMLKELDNRVRAEQTERKYSNMFDKEKSND